MPTCCRCNGSGRCTNCCCKKAGRFCSCLPSRKNHCGNQAPSELNRVYPGRSSSAENRTDTADDLERTPNPPPAVTVFEPVDVPTLPTTEDSNEAQMENPIVNPTDMLPPYTPISPIDFNMNNYAPFLNTRPRLVPDLACRSAVQAVFICRERRQI